VTFIAAFVSCWPLVTFAQSPSGQAADSTPSSTEKPAGSPTDEASAAGAAETFNAALERLAKLEFDLERSLASTRLDVASARRRFEVAEQRLDSNPEPDEILREEVAARRLEFETEQRIATLLEGRIERLSSREQAWRRLHALANDAVTPESLADWGSESGAAADDFAREASVKEARLDEVRRDLAFTQEQLEELPASTPQIRWVKLRKRALEGLEAAYEADSESIETARELEERLATQLTLARENLPLTARMRGTIHTLREVWNYKLTGSEPEPITLGKIVSALVIFVIGWLVARLIASLLGSRVFPKMRLEEGAAAAFESLAFYVLMLVAFLTALRMVQIPLTAFAVAGGALAIGVGFGSQNVVNNFISGIILLVERPIKRSDLVEVEGVFGNVEQIGLRSTRVRTGDNVHIIVPNAAFLESKVVNWTHSDARVRITITVGVAYGSPTREVERLIAQAVLEHPAILPHPEPIVIFTDFGDNALGFETRFWIEMRTVIARLRIESDVRFRIDELFREAGITIAFPQRDVHLDSLAPVEVRIVSSEPRESEDDREA
jgi:small-conductance mechanosensitive channel